MRSMKVCLSAACLSFMLTIPALPSSPESVGQSYTPILGYDDKNGMLYGAAAFLYREGERGFNAGLYGACNFRDFGGSENFSSVTLDLEDRGTPGWILGGHGLVEKSFDYYYGEGGSTRPEDPLRLSQTHETALISARHEFSPHSSLGPFAELRSRHGLDDPLFPDETTPAAGLKAVWDSRNFRMNPSAGAYAALAGRAMDGALQAEADFRHFLPLGSRVVQAFRCMAGVSSGEPDYLYRYRLGGTELLRGYQDNRFRGRNFYVVQEELRVVVWRMVSCNVSADLGNASDHGLEAPHLSGQAGLRIGLPPSYGMKARLELGFSPDNRSLALQFGEVF